MAYRDYDQSPAMQFARFVMRSFRIGHFFGVEVRMYWAAAILMPLIFASLAAPISGTFAETVALTAILFVGLFVIVWTHEMGHIVMGWRHRIGSELITLSPMGGIAHMNAPATTPRAELQIALAGPAVHLVWLAVFWPLQLLLPRGLVAIDGWHKDPLDFAMWFFVTTNVNLLVFNLLPIFPLDGGRAGRALLSMRWHPNRATMWATTAGMIGGGLLIVLAFSRERVESMIGVCIGLSCISACIHERRVGRHALIYDESLRRELWESDPEAWKNASAAIARDLTRPPRQPGFIMRWRVRRADRRAETSRAAELARNREVDEVLERVHEVGLTGLTDREKAVLERAAARRRGVG